MPSYTRGKKRDQLRFVAITDNVLYYGFNTKDFAGEAGLGITQADMNALGHLEAAAVPGVGIRIIAANSPKPPRMKKVVNENPGPNQQGDASTFCAPGSVRTAETAGWKFVKPGRSVTITNKPRTWTMGAELSNGGVYLFPMNPQDAEAYGDLLGLKRPTQINSTDRQKAFSGTSRPRPARMKLDLPGGGSVNAFCSTLNVDNAITAGWQLTVPEIEYD